MEWCLIYATVSCLFVEESLRRGVCSPQTANTLPPLNLPVSRHPGRQSLNHVDVFLDSQFLQNSNKMTILQCAALCLRALQ